LIEKVWAKVNSNYESIAGGWVWEGLRAMTGAPSSYYNNVDYDADTLFSMVHEAFEKGYIMSASTAGSGND
jgi:hypothetical protein